jgi:hypothetical protein
MRDGGRVAEKILKAHEFEFSVWAPISAKNDLES